MGIQDRDYMRERNRRSSLDREPPFTPPSESPSLLTLVAFWVFVCFVVFKAFSWWEANHAKRPRAPAAVQSTPAAPAAPPMQTTVERIAAPVPAPQAVSLEPALTPTIYLCKAYDGHMFWSQAHCAKHNALIDRIATVPTNVSFEEQVAIAQRQRQEMAQLAEPPAAQVPVHDVAAPGRKARCDFLEARIHTIDELARSPLPGYEQDRLAAERKDARDEQFRLRC